MQLAPRVFLRVGLSFSKVEEERKEGKREEGREGKWDSL